MATETDADVENIEADTVDVDGYAMRGPDLDQGAISDGANASASGDDGFTPTLLAQKVSTEMAAEKVDHSGYETIRDADHLRKWIDEISELGHVAVDTETTSLDAMQAELVGVSLATAPGRACYIPVDPRERRLVRRPGRHVQRGLDPNQIPVLEALELLKPMLENPAVLKIAQNLKYDWLVLSRHNIKVAPFDDTMLLSYVLDAGRTKHGMDALSENLLGHTPIPFKEVAGSGKSQVTFDKVPINKATAYAAEDADVTLRLWTVLKTRLTAEKMNDVYERLERPLIDVICRMEARGISVDRQILSRLSGELAQKAAAIEDEIYELAGEKLNIGSPSNWASCCLTK